MPSAPVVLPSTPLPADPPPVDRLEQAIASGDASQLKADDAQPLARKALALLQERDQLKASLLSGVSSEYDPSKWSQLLRVRSVRALPYLVGDRGGTLAAVGQVQGTRFAAYATNLLDWFNNGKLSQHAPAFQRVMAWLVGGDADAALPSTPLKVALLSGYDRNIAVRGLAAASISAQALSCDAFAAGCAQGADLVIVSGGVPDSPTLSTDFANLLALGKPVLYIHVDTWNVSAVATKLLAALDLETIGGAGNFYEEDKIAAGRPAPTPSALTDFVQRQADAEAVTGLDWSKCTNNGVGRITCGNGVPGLNTKLLTPLDELRAMTTFFNQQALDPFQQSDTRFMRIMLLLADVLRAQITYPMDKEKQPLPFQNAMLADSMVAYARKANAAQSDLGTFAGKSDPAQMPVSSQAENLAVELKAAAGFTSVGRYAVPGKTFTVELLDGGKAELKLRLNTQSSGSTPLWSPDTYDRPRYLQSPDIVLTPGQPVRLSTPYGGTMQLVFSGASAGQSVQLRIQGAARHPFYDSAAGTDPATFAAELQNSAFPWAEMKTGLIEVHSQTEMLRTSVQGSVYGGDAAKLVDETQNYLDKGLFGLAGYAGYPLPASVAAFCAQRGWDCTDKAMHLAPPPQHINNDKYTWCNVLCSGNPIDIASGFNPRGWGETHEIGHMNQPGWLAVYNDLAGGNRSIEVSNNIFGMHKIWRMRRDLGVIANDNTSIYKTVFDILTTAKGQQDPVDAAYKAIWESNAYAANNGQRMMFYMQWVNYWAAHTGSEAQGWDIITLLYLHQRQLASNALDWNTVKGKLGYSMYATRPTAVSGNDNLLIALSQITGRDQRAIFEQWGIRASDTAKAQVAALGLPAEPAFYYANTNTTEYSDVRRVDMTSAAPVWPFP